MLLHGEFDPSRRQHDRLTAGSEQLVVVVRSLHDMAAMVGYFLYFLLAVGLSILLTASFRRLRGDDTRTPPESQAEFDRRMAKIERRFGKDREIVVDKVPASKLPRHKDPDGHGG